MTSAISRDNSFPSRIVCFNSLYTFFGSRCCITESLNTSSPKISVTLMFSLIRLSSCIMCLKAVSTIPHIRKKSKWNFQISLTKMQRKLKVKDKSHQSRINLFYKTLHSIFQVSTRFPS